LIQRIKRTITYTSGDQEPVVKVAYLVEAIKTKDGVMKRPDNHFLCYGLGTYDKCQIVKEVETGLGQIEGIAQAGRWPFAANLLFKSIQRYQAEPGVFSKTRFTQSRNWKFSVEFDRQGNYAMKSDGLGIEILHRVSSGHSQQEQPAVERQARSNPLQTPSNNAKSKRADVPTLLVPRINTVMDNGRTDRLDVIDWRFRWTPVRDADNYEIFVKHTNSALSPVIDKKVRGTEYRSLRPGSFIADRNRRAWFWRVRAYKQGQPLPWSESRTFDVEPVNSDPPTPQRLQKTRDKMREREADRKLQLAKKFIKLRKQDSASKWLEQVVRDYPETAAAAEAKRLLGQARPNAANPPDGS
jgi:hypothetical protein